MDLHLMDAILKGHHAAGRVLDVGCGEGRNLHWFFHHNRDVFVLDPDASAIRMVQMVARTHQTVLPKEQCFTGSVLDLPWNAFDSILCINVLQHIPATQWSDVLQTLYQALTKGGELFLKVMVKEPNLGSGSNDQQLLHLVAATGFVPVDPVRRDEIEGIGQWVILRLGK